MAESKRRYIAALVFACILSASLLALLWVEHRERKSAESHAARCCSNIEYFYRTAPSPYAPLLVWVPIVSAIASTIGTISAIILAWRSDRRGAKESALKIAQLERELAEAKASAENPKTKKPNKKIR